jgi:endonuclease YncB( thermonuclease family)
LLLLLSGVVLAVHAGAFGHAGDDWDRYDHQSFRITRIGSGESIQITTSRGWIETVKLVGVAEPSAGAVEWLNDHALNRGATLLLPFPQTRDAAGNLLAFAFVDRTNLSVELVRSGLAFADRREKTIMDGVIDPAESDARKKKRGMWATLKFDQMPEWRKAWIKTLPGSGMGVSPMRTTK